MPLNIFYLHRSKNLIARHIYCYGKFSPHKFTVTSPCLIIRRGSKIHCFYHCLPYNAFGVHYFFDVNRLSLTYIAMRNVRLLILILPLSFAAYAQKDKDAVMQSIDAKYDHYAGIAMQIWKNPELGYLEEKSSALLQAELQHEGFTVQRDVAGMPTAFTATFGSGKPVIGILGEFDALPGMSQEAVPEHKPRIEGDPGHACGHHLFGTASTAAAIAVKEWMVANKVKGTIRFYGTPAEEGGSGKVYMVREGLFNDADAVVCWHPGDRNVSDPSTSMANVSAKFRFTGIAAHAAAAPEKGRSALDAVEAMDNMVNMMREHTPEGTRIHYIITKGGDAPNIVPAFAEVYYYARHKDREEVRAAFKRIVKCAEGAALGTETKMAYEIIGGVYDVLPNETLQKTMYTNLVKVGGVQYTGDETRFAEELRTSLTGTLLPIASAGTIQPYESKDTKASTDVGDVSWNVPTVELVAATWVPGTPAHSWQAVAAGGMSIGAKGMMVAAKTMALTIVDLMKSPTLLTESKKEFDTRRGPDFKYEALLGSRKPALDYRK